MTSNDAKREQPVETRLPDARPAEAELQPGPLPAAASRSTPSPVLRLDRLPPRTAAVVEGVDDRAPGDAASDTRNAAAGRAAPAPAFDQIARRLRELGFVGGERVEVVATGPFGGDPLLVQVGFTRFALRRSEAARVRVRTEAA